MRFSLPIFRRLAEALRKRDWFGIGFELFVVVIGVMLGMAASRWAAERDENAYRRQMLVALEQTMTDYEMEGGRIRDRIAAALADFERRRSAGEQPAPPIIRFPGMERPPTRAWEALVATGAARTIDPELMFRLALHFDRADSFGDKYQRYNSFTEQQILPFRGDPRRFYGPQGALDPAFAGHVEQLRELDELNKQMVIDAAALRRRLKMGEDVAPTNSAGPPLPIQD